MPINPVSGAPLPYGAGGGGSSMWAGGGGNPGFQQGPPSGPPAPAGLGGAAPAGLGGPMPVGAQGIPQRPSGPMGPPTAPPLGGPPQGMPLGLTPEILAMIQARMAAKQFRPGPENSLLPTGQGGGLAALRSGGY